MLYLPSLMTPRSVKRKFQSEISSIAIHLLINLDVTWLEGNKDSVIFLVSYICILFLIFVITLFFSSTSSWSLLVLHSAFFFLISLVVPPIALVLHILSEEHSNDVNQLWKTLVMPNTTCKTHLIEWHYDLPSSTQF